MTTLRELLERCGGTFVVPGYQRRYVWGQARPGEADSAEVMMRQVMQGYDEGTRVFLQGITLGAGTPATIVDGQQRLTFMLLLVKRLGYAGATMRYACRPEAAAFMAMARWDDVSMAADEPSPDVHFMKKSLRTIDRHIAGTELNRLLDYVLDNMVFMVVEVPDAQRAFTAFGMINGTKAPMQAADIIKAELMRRASAAMEARQGDGASMRAIDALRTRYATEWEEWVRWWHRPDVAQYYRLCECQPMELPIKMCLRSADSDFAMPLTYDEFAKRIEHTDADAFYYQLRCTQRRFMEAYSDSATYNRIQAIMLLQSPGERAAFLRRYFVVMDIDGDTLERCYKLSFLGMTTTAILRGDSAEQPFEELLATIGLSDVYHNNQAKAEVFKLLLRLNIDEDIKLGRKFDFSVWDNRSLEHIYSKSKVWHRDNSGRVCDGNDNVLHTTPQHIRNDHTYMYRGEIVNHDGMPLSEHCVGNLVLLYGQNNADFGNATFDQKKLMFLTPGGMTAFRSRNLLHSVCVFAGKDWTARSIVDNYNLTLKNLKQYYGYK